MPRMYYHRLGAFFVCLALISYGAIAEYSQDDAVAGESSHQNMKRAYMAHPKNCPDGFRKRHFIQRIPPASSYGNAPSSIARRLNDIFSWRQRVMRRRQMARFHNARLLEFLRAHRFSRRK